MSDKKYWSNKIDPTDPPYVSIIHTKNRDLILYQNLIKSFRTMRQWRDWVQAHSQVMRYEIEWSHLFESNTGKHVMTYEKDRDFIHVQAWEVPEDMIKVVQEGRTVGIIENVKLPKKEKEDG